MMHILFLSTWFPYPPDNGSKIRVYHLLQALGQRHDVTLLAFSFGTADPDHAEALIPYCQRVQVVYADPHRPSRLAWMLRFFSRNPVATQPIPEMRRLVHKTLHKQTFDVVIASTKGMASYALQVARPAVRVLEEHNSGARQMEERYRIQTSLVSKVRCWISWQKTRHFEQCIFQDFDLITMVSELDKKSTQDLLLDKQTPVEVIPNGVDCTHNRPGLAEVRPNTLIYTGALTFSANYDAMQWFLADIYPHIKRQVPDVTLTITGSTQGVDLSNLRLDDSVHLTGYVEDVRPFVAQSAVCIVPLRQGGGTRLKILEAMALGTPVVATSKGAEGALVETGEHLLIANFAEDFAVQTVCLLQNTTLQHSLSDQARQLVEHDYDWASIRSAFTTLVENAVLVNRQSQ
jgi:glycosyltransferase involved in cell wall biosynthesis